MKIQRLSRENKSEVLAVLMAAFHDYPVMRFVLRSTGDEYENHLRALVGFFCEVRLVRNWPVLGIRSGDSLVAAALVNEPVIDLLALPEEPLKQLRADIGEEAYNRLATYEEESSKGEPKKPHHFLGMIGVHPDYQGKGYAGALLNAVKDMSAADARSTGVSLSTENPANVVLYEHFGYRVFAEVDIDELHSWFMFLSVR
jgi:GNAT superfamily N-acetyltransferase